MKEGGIGRRWAEIVSLGQIQFYRVYPRVVEIDRYSMTFFVSKIRQKSAENACFPTCSQGSPS